MQQQDPSFQRRRRQRTVGIWLSTAAVAYGAYRLACWYFGDDTEQEQVTEAEGSTNPATPLPYAPPRQSSSRSDHFARQRQIQGCRDLLAVALPNFAVQVRQVIEGRTSVSAETKRLKQLRNQSDQQPNNASEQKAQWESIKVKSFTYAVSSAYAHVLLFLTLTAATHVAAGWQARDRTPRTENERGMDATHIHRLLLQRILIPFLVTTDEQKSGLERLIHAVQVAVTVQLENWDVTDPAFLRIEPEVLQGAMAGIDNQVFERQLDVDHASSGLIRFLLPEAESVRMCASESHGTDSNEEGKIAERLLNESLDLLESPVSRDAQIECSQICLQQIQRKVFSASLSSEDAEPALPLATILTQLRKLTKSRYGSSETDSLSVDWIRDIEILGPVVELCDVCFG